MLLLVYNISLYIYIYIYIYVCVLVLILLRRRLLKSGSEFELTGKTLSMSPSPKGGSEKGIRTNI